MLHTNRLKLREGTVISGRYGGKKVLCTPQALPVYDQIFELARDHKNYWADLIVRSIIGLSAGKLHQDNIYIRSEVYNFNKEKPDERRRMFYLVLPGVTATLKELDSGNYQLVHIRADMRYTQAQKAQSEPGLWKVHGNTDIKPEFKPDGNIERKVDRVVMIPDMATDDVQKIAINTRKDLLQIHDGIRKQVNRDGLDMHYTPGGSGLVGLTRARDALLSSKDRKITRSATLLANTMYQARSLDGVVWVSDWGGSAVLTRAMEILQREKGIKLQNHSIFMNRPTTPTRQAFALASKIGIEPVENHGGKQTGLRLDELRGRMHIAEVSKRAAGELTLGSLGAVGAGLAFLGPSLSIAGLVGIAGGLVTVTKIAMAGKQGLKGKKYQ